MVNQIDAEMAARAQAVGARAGDDWQGLLAEGVAYIEMALDPDVQRIVLRDGPAVLGDPSQWPSQNNCLRVTQQTVERLIGRGVLKPVDPEAAARLMNGAALNAALWVAASDDPDAINSRPATAVNMIFCIGRAPLDCVNCLSPQWPMPQRKIMLTIVWCPYTTRKNTAMAIETAGAYLRVSTAQQGKSGLG